MIWSHERATSGTMVYDHGVDKAAIFAEVLRLNALRREAQLSALNIAEEYQFAVALATWKEFEAICDQHRALHDAIRAAVVQELRDEHNDPSFGQSLGARILIRDLTLKRFYAALEAMGYNVPPF